jgi:hypothetical protein
MRTCVNWDVGFEFVDAPACDEVEGVVFLRKGGEFLMMDFDILGALGYGREVDAVRKEINESRSWFDMFGEGVKLLLDIMEGHLVKRRPDSFTTSGTLSIQAVSVEGRALRVFPVQQ